MATEKEEKAVLDLTYFPNFVRAVNPAAGQFSNEDLNELGEEFSKYLQGLDVSPAIMEKMVAIGPKDVIPNIERMGYVCGYHAALVWHFNGWVKQLLDKAGIEIRKA